MDRINGSAVSPDLFGVGKDGFRDGNKAAGIAATLVNAEFLNAVQEEIAGAIEGSGVALIPGDNTQLLTAIRTIAANYGNDYIARFTTIANINLTGLGTQAGGDWAVALTAGDIMFVKDQAAGAQNGWYVAAAGAWSRAAFADTSAEIKPGVLTQVREGATLADSIWILTTDAPVMLGTTALAFARKDSNVFASSAEILAGIVPNKSVSPAGLLAGLLGAGGASANDYVTIPFRDKTDGSRKSLIIQWVSGGTTTAAAETLTLPITFPNAFLAGFATDEGTAGNYTPRVNKANCTTSSVYVVKGGGAISDAFTCLIIGY